MYMNLVSYKRQNTMLQAKESDKRGFRKDIQIDLSRTRKGAMHLDTEENNQWQLDLYKRIYLKLKNFGVF